MAEYIVSISAAQNLGTDEFSKKYSLTPIPSLSGNDYFICSMHYNITRQW